MYGIRTTLSACVFIHHRVHPLTRRQLTRCLCCPHTRFKQSDMAVVMPHTGLIFDIAEHFTGCVPDCLVPAPAHSIQNHIQVSWVKLFCITAGQWLIMQGVNIPPDPPFFIPDPLTQTQPARKPQHCQHPAHCFTGRLPAPGRCQL